MSGKAKIIARQAGLLLLIALGVAIWIKLPLVILTLGIIFAGWLFTSHLGAQTLAIAGIGLVTVPERLGATSVIVVGIAGVVGVMIALLAMAAGFEATLKGAGSKDSAIVLRAGADAELSSGLDRNSVTLISEAPGILRDTAARPITSAEVVVVANLPKKSSGTAANVELRGVGAEVWALRPNVRIISGRAFRPGLREMVTGEGALGQFAGLDLGSTLRLNNQTWKVVGIFHSGDAHDSEIWGDAESVAAAYRRNVFQSVTVRLVDAAAFNALKAALTADPRLKVDVQTTRDYYTKQSERLTTVIRALGTGIAVIMAIGAGFGALNTMYAAIAGRAREIATLRALGFTGLPVVVSALLEAMILALFGGIIGALVAYGVFNGYSVSTLGSNFSQVVFQFRVGPALLLRGLQWALAIGFVGGLYPALAAARIPVVDALREL
jgi:putative ABC transport system permease protein